MSDGREEWRDVINPEAGGPAAYNVDEPDTDLLLTAYAQSRDPHLRERLIIRHLPLVSSLARRFGGRGEQLDDLIQVGTVGLIQAIDRYDPQRAVSFRFFAIPTILGEISHYLRDKARAIRLPRSGRDPFAPETWQPLSLDRLNPADLPAATWGEEDPALVQSEDRALVEQVISRLSPRERILLYLRFYANLSQSQIAQGWGISQMQVSRLEHRALEKVKQSLKE